MTTTHPPRTAGGLPLVEGYIPCSATTPHGGRRVHAVRSVGGVLAPTPICNVPRVPDPVTMWVAYQGGAGPRDARLWEIAACRRCVSLLVLATTPQPGRVQCVHCRRWLRHLRFSGRGLCAFCATRDPAVDLDDYPSRRVPARDRVEDYEFLRTQMGYTLTQAAEHLGIKRETLYGAILRERKRERANGKTGAANR